MTQTAAAIEFQEVSYEVQGYRLVEALNFQVKEGEILTLLGRSGSGKSTTLKLINGLLMRTKGHVKVQGQNTTSIHLIQLRRQTGYVIQSIGLLPHLTIERNIGLVPKLLNWPQGKIQDRVFQLMEQVDLSPESFAQRYPNQLSGGQQQRVGIARALAAEPPILLMDEPFGALDPITRHEIQGLFLNIQKTLQKTVVLITHDIQEALRLGDRIGLMKDGQIIAMSAPQNFMQLNHPEALAFQATVTP